MNQFSGERQNWYNIEISS